MTFQTVGIIMSALFTIAVIDFIRRNRLKERYALLWLAAGVAMVVLSAWSELLKMVTSLLGFGLPSNGLFTVVLFFLILIVFHFSIAVSTESERTKRLAQEIALLKEGQRSASIVAESHTYCLKVRQEFLEGLSPEHRSHYYAAMYRFLAELLAQRLEKTSGLLAVVEKELAEVQGR